MAFRWTQVPPTASFSPVLPGTPTAWDTGGLPGNETDGGRAIRVCGEVSCEMRDCGSQSWFLGLSRASQEEKEDKTEA